MRTVRHQPAEAVRQLCFSFDEEPFTLAARSADPPTGWEFKLQDAEHGCWSWNPPKLPSKCRNSIDIDIEYSPYGWMWGVNHYTGTGGGGYAALEKWRNFARTPAEALLEGVLELVRREGYREDASKPIMSAAGKMRDWVSGQCEAAPAPASMTMAECLSTPPPPGYYAVRRLSPPKEALKEVFWQDGGRWWPCRPELDLMPERPGKTCEPFNDPPNWSADCIVTAVPKPISPAESHQLEVWAEI